MVRFFLKPLSVRQMRLLCASLLAGFALCGALQGLCWGAAGCRGSAVRRHPAAAHPGSQQCRGRPERQTPGAGRSAGRDAAVPGAQRTGGAGMGGGAAFAISTGGAAGTGRAGHLCLGAGVYRKCTFPPGATPLVSRRSPGADAAHRLSAARGRNWWCVLYPGLCSFAQGGYALPAENDLVCGQYIPPGQDWAHLGRLPGGRFVLPAG